ncbi:MFS transporter, partial [Staphylococcus saprophyticus]
IFISEETAYVNKVKHNNIIKDLFTSYKNVSRDKRFIFLVLGITLLYTGEMTISNYIAVRLNDDFNSFNIFDVTINGARMFAIINLINTLIVAFFTLYIGNIIEKFNIKSVFILGLTLYTLGYTGLMSANYFGIIIIAIIIATFGELIYAPIYNSEQLNLIPKNKRGSYNAFSALSLTGSELLSRLTIILGVFFSPLAMSLIMFFTLSLGSLIVFRSLFEKTNS